MEKLKYPQNNKTKYHYYKNIKTKSNLLHDFSPNLLDRQSLTRYEDCIDYWRFIHVRGRSRNFIQSNSVLKTSNE